MKLIHLLTATLIITFLNSCATLYNTQHELFQIVDLYYQSWVVRDLEKGTNVIIKFRNLDKDIEFESLVFRGIEVDISVLNEGRKTIVKGTINTGPSLIENYEYEVTGSGDMIKYKYMGREFSYPLKNIKRENTKFIGK